MDGKRPSPSRETFIIRLWQRESDLSNWLGQIQHVGSKETAVIHSLDELNMAVKKLLVDTAVSTPTTKLK